MRQHWDGGSAIVRLILASVSIATAALSVDAPASAAEAEPTTRQLETLVRNADFDAAERVAQRLLRSGQLARAEAARVYLQLGIVSSAKRETARAEAALRKALRLDGELRLSPSVGPHVAANLARAKASISSSPPINPTVALTTPSGSTELLVATTVRRDEDGLLRRISVNIGDAHETRDLGEAPLQFSIALPATVATCATATASILDEFGNELWPEVASAEFCRPRPRAVVLANKEAAAPVATPQAAADCREIISSGTGPPSRSLSHWFWIAAAATGAAVLGTTLLGLTALERRDEYHLSLNDGSSAQQQSRLRELALTAEHRTTAGAIAAGLFGVATVVFYIGGRF
jgi:hypothetical protein